MDKLDRFLDRAERLMERLERTLPKPDAGAPDWNAAHAFRWQRRNGRGELRVLHHLHQITLADLCGIDEQKARVEQNTRQFVAGRPPTTYCSPARAAPASLRWSKRYSTNMPRKACA